MSSPFEIIITKSHGLNTVSGVNLNGRTRYASVITPSVYVQAGKYFSFHRLGDEFKKFNAVMQPVWCFFF